MSIYELGLFCAVWFWVIFGLVFWFISEGGTGDGVRGECDPVDSDGDRSRTL